jgi:hypothetical protein
MRGQKTRRGWKWEGGERGSINPVPNIGIDLKPTLPFDRKNNKTNLLNASHNGYDSKKLTRSDEI